MPFDGTTTRGATAVRVIDLMIEMFDGGNGWDCNWANDKSFITPRCLMSAIQTILARDRINGGVASYMVKAIDEIVACESKDAIQEFDLNFNDVSDGWNRSSGIIITFNDLWNKDESDRYKTVIEPMLIRAREIALTDV